ncbi:MAG: hypothetical protein V1793_06630 [Pseudomonadota bacterium]
MLESLSSFYAVRVYDRILHMDYHGSWFTDMDDSINWLAGMGLTVFGKRLNPSSGTN